MKITVKKMKKCTYVKFGRKIMQVYSFVKEQVHM